MTIKKIIAVLLCALMIFSISPLVFADYELPIIPVNPGGKDDDGDTPGGDENELPILIETPVIAIKNYQPEITVRIGERVQFNAETKNLGDARIRWMVNGQDLGGGESYTTDAGDKTLTVKAVVLNSKDEVLAETETETVYVNTGFFARLIVFIKGLFGLSNIIVQ